MRRPRVRVVSSIKSRLKIALSSVSAAIPKKNWQSHVLGKGRDLCDNLWSSRNEA